MNSVGIGIFTFVLAIAVGVGDFFLVPFLSNYCRDSNTMFYFSLLLILAIGSVLFIKQLNHLYISFFVIGLAIATTTTTLLVIISNVSHIDAQGQTMGLALSLRTLGDSLICFIGGLLISFSFKIPIFLSVIFGVYSLWIQGKSIIREKMRPTKSVIPPVNCS